MSKGIHPRIKMRWRNIEHVLDSFPKNKAPITAKEIYLDLEKRGEPLNLRTVRSILNQLHDEQQLVISKRGIQDSKKSVSFYKINPDDTYKPNKEQELIMESNNAIIKEFKNNCIDADGKSINDSLLVAVDDIQSNFRSALTSPAKATHVRKYEYKFIFEDNSENLSSRELALVKGSQPFSWGFVRMFRYEPITELVMHYHTVMKDQIGFIRADRQRNTSSSGS